MINAPRRYTHVQRIRTLIHIFYRNTVFIIIQWTLIIVDFIVVFTCICQWKWIEIEKSLLVHWYIYDHCLWVYTVIYWTLLNPQKLMSRNINETTVCSWYMYFLLWLTSNISWRLILIKEGLPLAHLQFSLGAEESFYKTVPTRYLKSKLYYCIIRTFEPLKAAIFHSWCVNVVYFYRDGKIHFNNYHMCGFVGKAIQKFRLIFFIWYKNW